MNYIKHILATRKAKREPEADPQWPGSVPVQFVGRGHKPSLWPYLLAGAIICGLWFAAGWAWGIAKTELIYQQALEDERVEAEKKAERDHREQKRKQEACGGENAQVIELATGGFACLDKNGRRHLPSGKP